MDCLRSYSLDNGLAVNIINKTYRYFGSYFTVFLELISEIPVKREYFASDEDFENALSLLGEKQIYCKEIKRHSVYEEDISNVIDVTIRYFEENSLPYLNKDQFLKKFILKRFKEEQRKAEIRKLRDKITE